MQLRTEPLQRHPPRTGGTSRIIAAAIAADIAEAVAELNEAARGEHRFKARAAAALNGKRRWRQTQRRRGRAALMHGICGCSSSSSSSSGGGGGGGGGGGAQWHATLPLQRQESAVEGSCACAVSTRMRAYQRQCSGRPARPAGAGAIAGWGRRSIDIRAAAACMHTAQWCGERCSRQCSGIAVISLPRTKNAAQRRAQK